MTSIGSSIATILGGGSGIDTGALVAQLVSASRQPRESAITQKQTLNNTRISAVASAISSLDTFSTAISDALKTAAFSGQPASNDPSIAALSLLPGGVPQGLPAQIEVTQLAAAQVLQSVTLAAKTDPVGLGTLTLTTASGAHTITIDGTNNSLDGLASAINAASAGVTASVVTDNSGARLILKGATGAANAFTLTVEPTDTADVDLQRFTFDGAAGGMTRKQQALDSIVNIDGVQHQNSTNTLDNALPYVRIDLNKAAPGTLVTLASTEPTSSIKDLVTQFVSGYNTLRKALNAATAVGTETVSAGALAGDAGTRDMIRRLASLTTAQLATSGTYQTLSDLGVGTNQDGTLKLDTARLDAAIAADPQGVAQMINPAVSTASTPGLAKVVSDLKTALEDPSGAITASKSKYDQLATTYAKALEKLSTEMTDYETRLTTLYSAMGAKLSALKATQSYLEQQVSIWTNKNNN